MSLQPFNSTPDRRAGEARAVPMISSPVRKPAAAAPVFKPDFARSLRMHPRVATVVAALVFLAIVAFALSRAPMYEAEALVYVEPAASKVLDDGTSGQFDSTKYDSFLQQQMQTSQRHDILAAAVHSLPMGVWRGRSESEQQATFRLQNALKVERVLNSYQLSFTLKAPSPQSAATTLNAVVASFLQAGRKAELDSADQRAQILTEEKGRISSELDSARAEQARLGASLGMANPGFDSGNPYDAELVNLRTELAAARESHDIAAAQLASVSGQAAGRPQGLTAAADELIAGDAGLSTMRSTISQRRAQLSGLMAGLTPENPIYKQYQNDIVDLDRSLDAATTQARDKAERRLQDKLRTDLNRTGDVEARLNAQLAADTNAATSASPKLQRATELTADIQRLMKRYASVDDTLRSLQLEASGPGVAHLALAAAPPVYPVPSRRRLMLLASLPLALLCGAFAAVYLRKRDPRLYTGRDIEDLLGFTPLAVLPSPDDVPGGVIAEYVLRLAGGIENAYRTAGARTFVLTSAGTSLTVRSISDPLERKLQQLGLTVITVTARQMMDALVTEPGMAEASTRAGGEGIVAANLDRVKLQHNVVLIDCPTLIMSAETEYLVRCADATVLVSASGVTLRSDLMQSALLLERLGVRGIAAVLEGLHLRHADQGFRRAIADLNRRQSFDGLAAPAYTSPVPMASPAASEAVPTVLEIEHSDQPEQATVSPVETALPHAAHRDASVAADVPVFEAAAVVAPAAQELPVEGPSEPVQADRGVPVDFTGPHPEESSVEPEAASEVYAPRSNHRSVAARRPNRASESNRSWFQRIFQRDQEPTVSILPDEEEESEAVPPATIEALHSEPVPELDLPLHNAATGIRADVAHEQPIEQPLAALPELAIADATPAVSEDASVVSEVAPTWQVVQPSASAAETEHATERAEPQQPPIALEPTPGY